MDKIGIFFGTDTGSTRLIAKTIYKKLGSDIADKPININRIELEDLMKYSSIILGTPTYGRGDLPGRATGMQSDSWSEILPVLGFKNFTGKTIALYGLGDQEKYGATFVDAMSEIHSLLTNNGAKMIGSWPIDGYTFTSSKSVVEDKFVGLAIDQSNQRLLTDERIDKWLTEVKPLLVPSVPVTAE